MNPVALHRIAESLLIDAEASLVVKSISQVLATALCGPCITTSIPTLSLLPRLDRSTVSLTLLENWPVIYSVQGLSTAKTKWMILHRSAAGAE